jgi:4-amino-4-deoxychorismate lyase
MFLFETIRILNGEFFNLDQHQQRMNRSRQILFNDNKEISLKNSLYNIEYPSMGLFKCKVIYNSEGINSVTFEPYIKRNIKRLKLVSGGSIDYSHKYLDRSALDFLCKDYHEGDVIIIKDGLITDSSFSNLAFNDGKKWVTPRKPLLKGTQANRLISSGILKEIDIQPSDLKSYRSIKLINAMNLFEETPERPFRIDKLILELL